MAEPEPPLIVITGTTASGKDATGLLVASALGGEIVSLDSMKVYRGMDIGTDKPSIQDRELCPHHLIDQIDPHESMNLNRYCELARAAIQDIRARGKRPVLVGGTAMYLQGVLHGVLAGAPRDAAVRADLRQRAEQEGLASLHAELMRRDPLAAARIHPNDQQRIERALEVVLTTGQPISAQQAQWTSAPAPHQLFVLSYERARLRERIDARVAEMFARGLLEEVQRISAAGGFSEQSSAAIGYQEALAHLAGQIDRAAAEERTAARTRQFAKRQLTWFRSMSRAEWIERGADEAVSSLRDRVMDRLGRAHH